MLPKIQHPTFEVELPTTKERVRMRPMLVKEEKILLMGKQADSRRERLDAVRQIVNNCLTTKVDIDNITMIDLEWMFIKLRSSSVSNISAVSYRDNEDDKVYEVSVDLDKVEFKTNGDATNVIRLDDSISIVLKYPTVGVYVDPDFYELDEDGMFDRIVSSSIDKIFVDDVGHSPSSYSKEELTEFINELPASAYSTIRDFYSGMPSLFYEVRYTNSLGTERIIPLVTLDDFFMFV